MQIEEIMVKNVHTVSPQDTIRMGLVLIQRYEIRHLPVVEAGEIVGIISDRDLRDVCPSILGCSNQDPIWNTPIGDIMKRDVITAHPQDFVDEAAYTMYSARISCLPVVSSGKLVGIITATDLLATLVEFMGVHHPSSRIEIDAAEPTKALATISSILNYHHCHIDSLLVLPDTPTQNHRIIVRIKTMNPGIILLAFKRAGLRILWPHDLGAHV